MELLVIEDGGFRNFLPLTWTRPVYDLKCGISSLLGKILTAYGLDHCGLGCRDYLAELVAEQHPGYTVNRVDGDEALIINGRALFDRQLASIIPLSGPDCLYTCGENVVAARLSGANLAGMDWKTPIEIGSFPAVGTEEVQAEVISWPWELIHHNADQISADFAQIDRAGTIKGAVSPGAFLEAPDNLYIAEGARIAPGVVLDASEGPVYIAENVKVMPQATITGPAYIGPQSLIKIGAKIYEGTSIGEVCKVGGEVEKSIIHSYCNKQHNGFLGNAYLGKWINIGAGTNNSDMKNNYGIVRVNLGHEIIDTGSIFVGTIIGDHTKTGVHTMLNTGAVVGVGCNLFGAGFSPKFISSFVWGGPGGFSEYRLDKFFQVARRVMERRQKELGAVEEAVLRHIFDQTGADRGRMMDT
ncbi:MAG: GlmU family protein [Fidelibacterota bacterium]|nr:MAG: GlmU family protein [Candidatus Neomarinimicrobiota bacterium]